MLYRHSSSITAHVSLSLAITLATTLNSDTARYVYRLLAIKAIFEDPESFGFSIQAEALYQPYATRTVWVTSPIEDLAAFALEEGANLKALKTLNPWLRSSRLTVADGDSIAVEMPV